MSLPWHQTDNAHKFKLEEPGSVQQAAGWQIVCRIAAFMVSSWR